MVERRERSRGERARIAPIAPGLSLLQRRIREAHDAALRATARELGVDPAELGVSTEKDVPPVESIHSATASEASAVNKKKRRRSKKNKKKLSRYEIARETYLTSLQGTTRAELARSPKTRWIYKQLWRHNDLDIVARVGGDEGPWAGNAWGYYVMSEHWGKTRGEINNFNHAFYKALQRQVLPRGFVLPDGRALEKSCYAIEQVPVKRMRRKR